MMKRASPMLMGTARNRAMAETTSVPYTITTQGHYCFNRSLSTAQTSGAAITINADFVTLDLNGYRLTGGGSPGPGFLGGRDEDQGEHDQDQQAGAQRQALENPIGDVAAAFQTGRWGGGRRRRRRIRLHPAPPRSD